MSQGKGSSSSGRDKSAKSAATTDSRKSISVKLPDSNVDQRLANDSPVQVRGLSPSRTPRHEYLVETKSGFQPFSRNASGTTRNFSPHSSGTIPPQATPTRAMLSEKEVERIIAARIIERCWLSYRDRQMFTLLKHAICAAEHSISHEILRKVSPKEAELLKDTCMQAKIRFRFSGTEFPPMIYFKVFSCNTNGFGVKYVSGKKMIQPASEAAQDACRLMGHRLFYDQMIRDMMRRDEYQITDEVDVTTLKDYMQYLSLLDETPSYLGGRDNSWRKLTLEVLPRYTIFYDIVGFLHTRKMTPYLKSQLGTLLTQPTNEDIQLKHIQILSDIRLPEIQAANIKTPKTQNSSRRSRQARVRANKMRRAYHGQQEQDDPSGMVQASDVEKYYEEHRGAAEEANTREKADEGYTGEKVEEGEWEEEADKLYEWTQQLSYDEIAATPRLATSLTASRLGSVHN